MELDVVTAVALGLWWLAAVVTTGLGYRWGWPGLRPGLIVTVLLQALTAVLSVSAVWSPEVVGAVALGICVLGWIAEYLAVHAGCFGSYDYTDRLRPQVGGIPILVAIAYVGVLVPSWGVADLLVGGDRGLAFVIASAAAATATDLLLDPILVSWRVWEWRVKGGYFGIPWRNFLGWLCVTAGLTVVLRPGRLEPLPLLLLYTAAGLTGVLSMFTIWRLPGPAVVGGIVMGAITAAAWWRLLW